MGNNFRYLFIFLLSLMLTGCAASGKIIDQGKLSQIQPGVTTKQEAIRLLGRPDTVIQTMDGNELLTYRDVKYKTNVITYTPVWGNDGSRQALQVLINMDGKVGNVAFVDPKDSESQ